MADIHCTTKLELSSDNLINVILIFVEMISWALSLYFTRRICLMEKKSFFKSIHSMIFVLACGFQVFIGLLFEFLRTYPSEQNSSFQFFSSSCNSCGVICLKTYLSTFSLYLLLSSVYFSTKSIENQIFQFKLFTFSSHYHLQCQPSHESDQHQEQQQQPSEVNQSVESPSQNSNSRELKFIPFQTNSSAAKFLIYVLGSAVLAIIPTLIFLYQETQEVGLNHFWISISLSYMNLMPYLLLIYRQIKLTVESWNIYQKQNDGQQLIYVSMNFLILASTIPLVMQQFLEFVELKRRSATSEEIVNAIFFLPSSVLLIATITKYSIILKSYRQSGLNERLIQQKLEDKLSNKSQDGQEPSFSDSTQLESQSNQDAELQPSNTSIQIVPSSQQQQSQYQQLQQLFSRRQHPQFQDETPNKSLSLENSSVNSKKPKDRKIDSFNIPQIQRVPNNNTNTNNSNTNNSLYDGFQMSQKNYNHRQSRRDKRHYQQSLNSQIDNQSVPVLVESFSKEPTNISGILRNMEPSSHKPNQYN